MNKIQKTLLQEGASQILKGLGVSLDNPNFINTPKRISDVLMYYYRGIQEKEKALKQLDISFPSRYKEMIVAKHMVASSLCPHHLLPIHYVANFSYLPKKDVVGASKPYKVFEILAAQPILQEDLTEEFVREFQKRVNPLGCILVVTGKFHCHEKENIDVEHSTMITRSSTGVFKTDIEYERRFFEMLQM